MAAKLAELLNTFPRVSLTRKPSPLDYLPNFSKKLGVEFHLKRDDLSDLALGGDKPRKLEFELGQALANEADILVTCGSSQSNLARLTTAAARKVGMDCALVLSIDKYKAFQGNLLTAQLMGAEIRFVESEDHWDLEEEALELCEALRADGRKPHYIPVSGTTPHSCLGYVDAGLELADQIKERNLDFDAIYAPFGTGGIFTAVLMALRAEKISTPMIGISVNREKSICLEYMDKWWSAISDLLEVEMEEEKGEFEIFDAHIGQEYGDPTEEGLDAILLMARTEGILMDPVYSGKVLAGILAHTKDERWRQDQRIMMIHSGGVPALFAYDQEIKKHMEKRGLM